MGKLSKHGVKQVDRLLSNQGIDVWEFFGYWIPYLVGARTEVVVAMDWTSFARDQQDTVVLSMLTGHGRATPLMWMTVRSSAQGRFYDHQASRRAPQELGTIEIEWDDEIAVKLKGLF